MSYFNQVESCRSRQCGGATDPMETATASLDDALVNIDQKITTMEEQKRKLITLGGMDDVVDAVKIQIDQMKDQKTKALSARDLAKQENDAKLTADQALTDLSTSLNKVVTTVQGSCLSDTDCMGTNICDKGMCTAASWYQVKYWGLPLWGWILIGILLLAISIGLGIYHSIPYIETALNSGTSTDLSMSGTPTTVPTTTSPLNDMGSMAGTSPGFPGSA